jgi:hypothetical protein
MLHSSFLNVLSPHTMADHRRACVSPNCCTRNSAISRPAFIRQRSPYSSQKTRTDLIRRLLCELYATTHERKSQAKRQGDILPDGQRRAQSRCSRSPGGATRAAERTCPRRPL